MTTLLEMEDGWQPLQLKSEDDKLYLIMDDGDLNDIKFNLTKEKARLLIESIQGYFKLDA